jgi:hypothetical protein
VQLFERDVPVPSILRAVHLFCRCCIAVFLFGCFLISAACSDAYKPPFIKAQVIDVYNNKTDIYNARFQYWWQERGETAFLDTHSSMSRDLLTTIVAQHSESSLTPVRIHLKDIRKIEWEITEKGKKMLVSRIRGPVVETKCLFPKELRVDPASGLADYTCFIIGSREKNQRTFDFKQDLNFIKSITVTGIDEGR